MRCLHCNKKLSLLKLAKGDSFCSHEHFDAYQLKLSKDAIERLMSVPAEEGPKPPLVLKQTVVKEIDDKQIEEAPPSNNDAPAEITALARLTAYAPPPLPEAPASQSPPYAPFATSPLPPCTLNPAPIANGPDASESVQLSRVLAYPVHPVDQTVCILSLYLRLGFVGAGPKNWTSEPRLIVAPENFRLDIKFPRLGLSPEFPEIESPSPVDADPMKETMPFVEDAPSIEPVPRAEPATIPVSEPNGLLMVEHLAHAEPDTPVEPAAPVAAEPVVEALPFVELAPPVKPAMYPEHARIEEPPGLLLIENLVHSEPVKPIEPAAVEGLPFAETPLSSKPMMPVEPPSLGPIEPSEPRVPFLMAPSFRARSGTPILLHSRASAKPKVSKLPPVLDDGSPPRLDSCRAIPNFTSFAGPAAIQVHDSIASWIGSTRELTVQPSSVLPNAREQMCGDAWTPTDHRILIDLPSRDASWASIRSLDFDLAKPASLLSRPDPVHPRKVDPQQLLAGTPLDVVSLFLGVLETRPLGPEPLFIDPPAYPTESGWQAILAPVANPEHLPAAWRYRTSHFSQPDPIFDRPKEAILALASLHYLPACIKVDRIEKTELPGPYVATDLYRQTTWPETDSESVPLDSESSLIFIGLKTLPQAVGMPAGRLKTGSGAPALNWEPRLPAALAPPAMRFLPVRNGTVLPSAKDWPLLERVPR
jgi:hypothetical protein